MSQYLEKLNINKICIWGIVLRLFMLFTVTVFSKYVTTGLLGSDYTQDDVRYLAGAEIYASTASGLLDYYAIEKAFDTVEPSGVHSEGLELWYWMISITMFLFRTEIVARIINILFAIVSIKCIYDICCSLYDKRIAKLAAILYAVLPYPVIFSCFLYKDQFYTMLTLLLFRKAIECAGHITVKDIIYMIVGLILSQLTRSGVVILIFISMTLIIYNRGNYKIHKISMIVVFVIFAFVSWYIIMQNIEHISKKVYAYILESSVSDGNTTIAMFEIKSPGQLYRYPFAYLFALVQPLSISIGLKTWSQLAGILNILALPIAIANFFYLMNFKIKKDYFFLVAHILYFVTILASLGIVRHQFFLQPFMMIYGALYVYKSKNLMFWKLSSLAAVLIVFSVWIIF